MTLPIEQQAWDAFTRTTPRYHQPDDHATPEAPVTLPIVADIENALSAAGHTVDEAVHGVLSGHLTLANLAAHVASGIADVQANPLAPLVEHWALGAGGEAFLSGILGAAEAFAHPAAPVAAAPAPNLQAGEQPAEPAPAQ